MLDVRCGRGAWPAVGQALGSAACMRLTSFSACSQRCAVGSLVTWITCLLLSVASSLLRAIRQPGIALQAKPAQPLRDRPHADTRRLSRRRQRPPLLRSPAQRSAAANADRYARYRATSSGPLLGAGGFDTPSLQAGPDGTTFLGTTPRAARPCIPAVAPLGKRWPIRMVECV